MNHERRLQTLERRMNPAPMPVFLPGTATEEEIAAAVERSHGMPVFIVPAEMVDAAERPAHNETRS